MFIQSFTKTGQLVQRLWWGNTHTQKARHTRARAAWLSWLSYTSPRHKGKQALLYYHIPTLFQIATKYYIFNAQAYTRGNSLSESVHAADTPHVSRVTLVFQVSRTSILTKVSRSSLRCPRENFRMLWTGDDSVFPLYRTHALKIRQSTLLNKSSYRRISNNSMALKLPCSLRNVTLETKE
jgi:hypothetical protein